MNILLNSLRIRAHLSWRTGKHLHVLHVLRTYSTCSCPGQQDTTTYAPLLQYIFACSLSAICYYYHGPLNNRCELRLYWYLEKIESHVNIHVFGTKTVLPPGFSTKTCEANCGIRNEKSRDTSKLPLQFDKTDEWQVLANVPTGC